MNKKSVNPLEAYRKKIDAIDAKIGKTLIERMKIIKKIADYKAKHALSTKDTTREQMILNKCKISFQKAIFKKILQESRKLQKTGNRKHQGA